ncbi:hypothetical protein [Pseudoalteromonas rhizosphaerae]
MEVGAGFSHEGFNTSDKFITVGAKLAGACNFWSLLANLSLSNSLTV